MAFPGFQDIAYEDFTRMVETHYGKYSEMWWKTRMSPGFDGKAYMKAIEEMPGVQKLYNYNGKLISYGYKSGLPAVVDTAFNEQVGNINSNIYNSVYGQKAGTALMPTNAIEVAEDAYVMETGARTVSTGAKVMSVLDRASLALIGVSAGAKLGKVIDQAIYETNPDWWDEHFPTINPETWDSMAGENELGRTVIDTIFGIDPNSGQLTMYVPEKMLAQTYMTLRDSGAWDAPSVRYATPTESMLQQVDADVRENIEIPIPFRTSPVTMANLGNDRYDTVTVTTSTDEVRFINVSNRNNVTGQEYNTLSQYSKSPFVSHETIRKLSDDALVLDRDLNGTSSRSFAGDGFYTTSSASQLATQYYDIGTSVTDDVVVNQAQIAWLTLFSEDTTPGSIPGVRDDTPQRAPIQIDPNTVTGTTVDDVLQQLKLNYPPLFDDMIYTDLPNELGDLERTNYVPVPIPQGMDTPYPYIDPQTSPISQSRPYADPTDETAPLTETFTQYITREINNPANNPDPAPTPTTHTITETIQKIIVETVPQVQPQDVPDNLTKTIIEIVVNQPQPDPNPQTTIETIRETIIREIPQVQPEDLPDSTITTIINVVQGNPEPLPDGTPQTWTETQNPPPYNPNPPDTGEGDSPEPVPVEGSASSLWAVYNPTQAQLNAFGAWLWSSSFIDQIKRIFASPMDGVIGVHKIFATPETSGNSTIVCGYLDSQVPSKVVSNQYTAINCGTVYMVEYFGNVFDYSPFTRVSLFLPFIGIVQLNVADIMRSHITVIYHVDVITGACLAEVKVNRDGAGGVIYTYAGSCAVSYPLSSGSYAGIVGGVISIGAGIVGSIMSGGALLPAMVGASAALPHLHTNVQKSGSFSGCAGAMGGKIPYLIVTRPQIKMANNFEMFEGVRTNEMLPIGSCSGFVKCKAAHLKIGGAFREEIVEIERMLSEGILI